KEYIITHRAVFFPTPGRESKNRSLSSSVIARKGASVGFPKRDMIALINCLMVIAFWLYRPPGRIASAISSSLAAASRSKVGNARFRDKYVSRYLLSSVLRLQIMYRISLRGFRRL